MRWCLNSPIIDFLFYTLTNHLKHVPFMCCFYRPSPITSTYFLLFCIIANSAFWLFSRFLVSFSLTLFQCIWYFYFSMFWCCVRVKCNTSLLLTIEPVFFFYLYSFGYGLGFLSLSSVTRLINYINLLPFIESANKKLNTIGERKRERERDFKLWEKSAKSNFFEKKKVNSIEYYFKNKFSDTLFT